MSLYYIAFREGFLQYEFADGETQELIHIKGFTRDIRKATGIIDVQQAAGVMKFAIQQRESDAKYCCILRAVCL